MSKREDIVNHTIDLMMRLDKMPESPRKDAIMQGLVHTLAEQRPRKRSWWSRLFS